MLNARLDRRFRTIALLGMVVCVVTTAATAAVFGARMRAKKVGSPLRYEVGSIIDLPRSFYSSSQATLIAFVRANCPACQDSKPAFVGLAKALRDQENIGFNLVVPPALLSEDTFAKEIGLDFGHVLSASPSSVRVRVVPTVVVVNREGRVLFSHEGAFAFAEQVKILDAVRAASY